MEDQFSTEDWPDLVLTGVLIQEESWTQVLQATQTVKEDRGKSICQLRQKDGAELLNS